MNMLLRPTATTGGPASPDLSLVWASATGVQAAAQQPRIEELLHAQETFAEKLLDELGFPETVHSAPQP